MNGEALLFLFAVILAAVLLFAMVFFVSVGKEETFPGKATMEEVAIEAKPGNWMAGTFLEQNFLRDQS